MAQLADGLVHIHFNNVTHRDFKSENILLTEDNILKIGDFGCSKAMPEGENSMQDMDGGDCIVVPPEFAQGVMSRSGARPGLVTTKYDIWGLGCILSEILSLRLLKDDRYLNKPLNMNKVAIKNIMEDAQEAHNGVLVELLQKLLDMDPYTRISAAEVRPLLHNILIGPITSQSNETQRMIRAFHAADTDHSGNLSLQELHSLLFVMGIQISASRLMEKFDRDQNGMLSVSEFEEWWKCKDTQWIPMISSKEEKVPPSSTLLFGLDMDTYVNVRDAFKSVDRDGDDKLSAASIHYLLFQHLGIKYNGNEGRIFFKNNSGESILDKSMTFDDFLHWSKDVVNWKTWQLKDSC
eukprot:NODE_3762_length_1293_cov_7.876923_g3293_i0.p1 GENE.NODE_3762_length_1293_cov_7.876923_g3293_i0~~NODE_3762_length_1293_cov_7.876923_g3293_i0.p1  ORF type:complete len:410 (+),score=85.73 NODE_3762_length_1293_cov_7.876923_g3293_i0:178-1230(+)